LRRTHPPPGPHHSLAHRRLNNQHQWCRPLRSLQPHQRNPRLDRPLRTRSPPHPGNHHSDRPQLPLHCTTPAGDTASPTSHRPARLRAGFPPASPDPGSGEGSQEPQTRCRRGGLSALRAGQDASTAQTRVPPSSLTTRRRHVIARHITGLRPSARGDSGLELYDNRAGSVLGLKEGRVASYAVMSGSCFRVSPMSSRPSRRRHRV